MTACVTTAPRVSEPSWRVPDLGHELWAEDAVPPKTWGTLRRRTVLEGCKWDPQVGDVDTLAPFPLVLKSSAWRQIASLAERLTREAVAAEQEIIDCPNLLAHLGLPRRLRHVLSERTAQTPPAGRVMRFDFHHTARGWRISEANSDVPGGFTEASHYTAMIAELFPSLRPAGDPGAAWSDALAAAAGPSGVAVLLSAPGYTEDYQVVSYLAARLRERGCRPHLAKPEQIVWRDGLAHLDSAWHRGPVDAIVRFYQAEWLSRLPRHVGWSRFFRGGQTPIANPALAIISESKRFPLVWDELTTPMLTWRALLPETRDPRDAPWSRDDGWLLKTAFCNTGDTVSARAWMKPRDWLLTRLAARLAPGNWVAQRRFESRPVLTPAGPRHVCLGVYTVNGRAAGIYGRCSPRPLIDFAATDVAVLLEDDE